MLGRDRQSERTLIRALDDVSFEIPEGQSTAIIGENGAGKTTALKLATRIAYPTRGEIRVRGRVGALIEVGTGMHPELTGRENIHLYGRILGLSGRDINQRFDEIVAFSGIERAIDQPVKQYSSGMQLRLGFAVASHLEPDVFIVDEAIAVGDAGFHYRCVERMSRLVEEGRTLVFVSHDLPAIERLCSEAYWLSKGTVTRHGRTPEVVGAYLDFVEREVVSTTGAAAEETATVSSAMRITGVTLIDPISNAEVEDAVTGRPITIRLHYATEGPVVSPHFIVGVSEGGWRALMQASMVADGLDVGVLEGVGAVDCHFSSLPLRPRVYEIWGSVRGAQGYGAHDLWRRLRGFRVKSSDEGNAYDRTADSPIVLPHRWVLGVTTAQGQDHPAPT